MWWRVRNLWLFVLIALMGCRTKVDEVPLIRTGAEMGQVAERARTLSERTFLKFDSGQALSEEEKKDLRIASMQFEGILGFDPKAFNAFFGAGKAYFILEENERAADRFERAASTAPLNDTFGKQTAAEAKYLASICYERLGRYDLAADSAKTATDLVPIAPQYYAQRASAALQLNQEKAAREFIAKALKLDPTNRKALLLAKFLKLTDTAHPKP
jgi:tetratricopeptide (TPR) repeat protein